LELQGTRAVSSPHVLAAVTAVLPQVESDGRIVG